MALPRNAPPANAIHPNKVAHRDRDRDREARRLQQAASRRRHDLDDTAHARPNVDTNVHAHTHARAPSLRRRLDDCDNLPSSSSRARAQSNATLTTLDSSSSPTAGRSFTVANFNNGIIYLRPSVRPAHHRNRPLPDPIFPQTPPDSATLDPSPRPTSDDCDESLFAARSPTRPLFGLQPALPTGLTPDHDTNRARPAHHLDSPPPPLVHHARSRSFSTADDHTVSTYSIEPGTFKVVIDRPGRPKTADTDTTPILSVPIPHYRLGRPRFSARGTAILRSSAYTHSAAETDDHGSFLTPQRAPHSFLSSRPRSDVYSPSSFNFRTTMDLRPPLLSSEPSSARISSFPIGPQIYDSLTADPDSEAVVRFSSTGDIIAATPSRLIAHITSPSFLDYELLSDFFLTFRSFLTSRELVAYLLARLRWAVNRQDDFGRIVRVRTFVALRHWILNYFVDDFVPKYRLRLYFCELVNSLYRDLKARSDGGAGDVKIIGELKKCWRRTCALYWDSESGSQQGVEEELLPGGQATTHPSVDETAFAAMLPSTPPREPVQRPRTGHKPDTVGSNPSDQFASRHMEWAHRARHTPQNSLSTPYIPQMEPRVPLSPESERSMQVLSCSIPMRGLNKHDPSKEVALHAYPVPHPIPAGPTHLTASPQQPTSPKKPGRPSHAHKRSGSFSDALRDNRTHLSFPKAAAPETDFTTVDVSTISKIPGTLVRGGLFQPGSPYIDVKSGGLRHARSRLELTHEDVLGPEVQFRSGHAANPGVKKLLGSVRRALSSRQPPASAPHFSTTFHQHSHSSSSRSSNAPTVPNSGGAGIQKRRTLRGRPQVRVDVLASAVADSFKDAVKEQMQAEQQHGSEPAFGEFVFDFEKKPAGSPNNKCDPSPNTRLVSGITFGSKSIPIVDDTAPLPLMSGALQKEHDAVTQASMNLARVASIDEKLVGDREAPMSVDFGKQKEYGSPDWDRIARDSLPSSPPMHRRSMSAERMHSFRRRGSTKMSMARPASLRRHASHASGLGRHQKAPSVATFQTMSSDNDPFQFDRKPTEPPLKPARQLRRRPGGDLRAADHVQELEQTPRPHSTGSVSNRTHSVANSIILRTDRFIESSLKSPQPKTYSEPEAEATKMRRVSLVDTHSSQPNLRPSFEAEVAKLAALPDDIDDDGGIESALMKLEGRYEKKSPDPSKPTPDQSPRTDTGSGVFELVKPPGDSSLSQTPSQYNLSQPASNVKGNDLPSQAEEQEHRRVPPVSSVTGTDDSYSSVPLLNRGVSKITSLSQAQTLDSMRSSAKPALLQPAAHVSRFEEATHPSVSSSSSIEYVIKTDSMKRIPKDATVPITRESFLLSDDDISDLGSARGATSDHSHGVRSFFDDETPVGEADKEFMPTHPLRHPPTPPLTANRLNDLPQVDTTVFDKGLATPGLTPTSRLNVQSLGTIDQTNEQIVEQPQQKPESQSTEPPHFPFILAYDSEALAQQFTIIEKDALDEIDWRELIELRWKQASPHISNWVQYLRLEETKGVDMVIARFNLVVKWAVSEIVLTDSIEERARCIVKYIHIAAHTRKLRNYATTYQITIALLSNDISRLRKTWSLVPAAEIETMKELEALVQPLKNFHNLRVEMETATVENGCIPFIGIYTRDLIYNAQKPLFIDAPPADGEKLVNFERHHTAATIVKSLLRLLEASSKYTFHVEPSIISKCLWIATLGDQEITRRSRQYE